MQGTDQQVTNSASVVNQRRSHEELVNQERSSEEDQRSNSPEAGSSEDVHFDNKLFSKCPLCRFCREPHSFAKPLVVPCRCNHSKRFVHVECIQAWMDDRNQTECPVCESKILLDVSFCRFCHDYGHGHLLDNDHDNELIAPCRY